MSARVRNEHFDGEVSDDLASGIARRTSAVQALVVRLGGYGARVRGLAGRQRRPVEGILVAPPTGDQSPAVETDDGRRWLCDETTMETAS